MHIFDFHQLYEVVILDMVTVAIQQEEMGFGVIFRQLLGKLPFSPAVI